MKALYKSAPGAGNVSLTDRPVPVLNETDNVLVHVKACAICGMDFHIYHGKFPCTPPFIMGHEFVGTVTETLPGVTGLKPGDRVTAQPHLYSCGTCPACRMGLTQFCADKRSIGINRDGAMAPYVAVPEKYLHKVPDNIPDKLACIIEPFSMVVGNFGIPIREEQAQTAVVIGAGQIGLLGVVAAKGYGIKQLIVSGVSNDLDFRFPTAKKLGANVLVDSTKENLTETVMELTNGVGADIVLEASGSQAGINDAISLVKQGGLISVMGGTKKDAISVNWDAALKKAIRLHFHMMSNYQYMDEAIRIFADPYTDLSPLITREAPLKDWEEVFGLMAEGRGLKNVLYID